VTFDQHIEARRVSCWIATAGSGFRVYFTQRGPIIIVISCGGDKDTNAVDIKRAMRQEPRFSAVMRELKFPD
jgi:putative addiction module killer protein